MYLILFLILSRLNWGRIELVEILLFSNFGGGSELEGVVLKYVYDGYCYGDGGDDGSEEVDQHCVAKGA
jgi:hypothetical protein